MDIQQILSAGTGKPTASNGSGAGNAGQLTGAGFAKALASLSPQAGASVASGSGAPSSLSHQMSQPTAAAAGEALPERLQSLLTSAAEGEDVTEELTTLLASAGDGEDVAGALRQALHAFADDDGLPEPLQVLLTSAAEGQDPAAALQRLEAGTDATDETASPELAAALQTIVAQLGPHQSAGQARNTAATPSSPHAAAQPGLAPGLPGPSTNPLLEATSPRADGTPNAATSAALATAEAVRQAAGGASPAPSATSPQAMLEALTTHQQGQGGLAQDGQSPIGGAFGGQATSSLTASSTSASPATAGMAQQASLSAPVGSPAWPRQLGQQLLQFSRQGGEQRIEMKLHPAELGPLSVTLKVGDQGAQAHFLSGHAQVRHALEQAIPQLREALADQGIALGETSVGEQHQGGTEGEGRQFADASSAASGEGEELSEGSRPLTPSLERVLDGRVDLYA